MKILENILSIKNIDNHKVINLCGLKCKIKIDKQDMSGIINKLNDKLNYTNNLIVDLYVDNIIETRKNEKFNLDKYLQNITTTPEYLFVDSNYNYLNMFLITAVPINCCHCSVFY